VDKKRKERNKNVQQKTETTRRISSSTKWL
jgi:hypothetical protein